MLSDGSAGFPGDIRPVLAPAGPAVDEVPSVDRVRQRGFLNVNFLLHGFLQIQAILDGFRR
jgi:hypothetical protein